MRDEEILIWYEDLETATCNTDSPEAGIISHVRDLISKQEEQIRQRDGEWVDAIEDTLHFGIIPETLAGAVECMKAWLEEREKRIRVLEAQIAETENRVRHETVTKINKLLGVKSLVDLERWEQLEIYILGLQARIERVKGLAEKMADLPIPEGTCSNSDQKEGFHDGVCCCYNFLMKGIAALDGETKVPAVLDTEWGGDNGPSKRDSTTPERTDEERRR